MCTFAKQKFQVILDQRAMALLAKIKSKEMKASCKLEHALNYMHNNWKALTAYIDVGSVLIDNNCCERAVRPFTNLRKSFGGFCSEKGGEVAAAWLTFIETCKLQKKASLDFFNEFFRHITEGRCDYELIAQEALGQKGIKTTKSNFLLIVQNPSKSWG